MSRLIDADALKFTEYLGMDEPVISKSEIDAAPTVEPKRGEWVEMRNPYGELEGWIHEECGFSDTCAFNFCPSCGADMRKEKK